MGAYIIDGNMARLAPPELLRKELGNTALANQNFLDFHNNNNARGGNNMHEKNGGGHPGPHISRKIEVSSDCVGFVIGKGGSKVAEIRKMSGANVVVNHESEAAPDGTRLVSMSGTEESVNLATFLVESTINMAMKDRGGGSDHIAV